MRIGHPPAGFPKEGFVAMGSSTQARNIGPS